MGQLHRQERQTLRPLNETRPFTFIQLPNAHPASRGARLFLRRNSYPTSSIPASRAATRSKVTVRLHPAALAEAAIRQSAKSALPRLYRSKAFSTVSERSTMIVSLVSNSASTCATTSRPTLIVLVITHTSSRTVANPTHPGSAVVNELNTARALGVCKGSSLAKKRTRMFVSSPVMRLLHPKYPCRHHCAWRHRDARHDRVRLDSSLRWRWDGPASECSPPSP